MFEGAWRPAFAMLRTRTSNIPRCWVANSRSRFRIAARASAARDQCSRSWPAVGEQFVEQLQRVVVVVSASAHALQLFGELSTHARPRLGCWLQPASCVYKLIYWPSIWHVISDIILLRWLYLVSCSVRFTDHGLSCPVGVYVYAKLSFAESQFTNFECICVCNKYWLVVSAGRSKHGSACLSVLSWFASEVGRS